MWRRVFPRLFALLAVVPLLVVSQTAASAGAAPVGAPSVVELTCLGSLAATVTPGITLFSAHQTVTAEVRGGTDFLPGLPCTSVTGVPYQGVTVSFQGSGNISCLVGRFSGTAVATWDNGDTSVASVTVTTVRLIPVIDATIIAGPLKGSTVLLTGMVTGIGGRCTMNGITQLSYVGIAAVLSV